MAKKKSVADNVVYIPLSDIHLSRKNRKALKRDSAQVEELRMRFEAGDEDFPIVLIARIDGEYDLEDGRHRFLAAELAGESMIAAIIKQ